MLWGCSWHTSSGSLLLSFDSLACLISAGLIGSIQVMAASPCNKLQGFNYMYKVCHFHMLVSTISAQ